MKRTPRAGSVTLAAPVPIYHLPDLAQARLWLALHGEGCLCDRFEVRREQHQITRDSLAEAAAILKVLRKDPYRSPCCSPRRYWLRSRVTKASHLVDSTRRCHERGTQAVIRVDFDRKRMRLRTRRSVF